MEEVCARFEEAWQAAGPQRPPPRIEEHLQSAAGADRAPLLRELLLLDIDYRRRRGERPAAGDYLPRFPEDAAPVRALLEASTPGSWCDGPGARFGDYELLEEIGRGGMGVVYRARQVSLNRIVAVKMVLPGAQPGGIELARFKAEAEASARLRHPNVVPIYDYGEHQGRPFFAMEYVGGGSLAGRLGGRPQPPGAAARLVATLARAL
jgi:serine/threonine-protein kinase